MKRKQKEFYLEKVKLIFILLLSFLFIGAGKYILATESSNNSGYDPVVMEQQVNTWLKKVNGKILEGKDESRTGSIYMAVLPDGDPENNIVYDPKNQQYVYQVKTNEGTKQIPLNLRIAMSTDQNHLANLSSENYQDYLAPQLLSGVYQRTNDGKLIQALSIEDPTGLYMTAVIELPDGTIVTSKVKSVNVKQDENFVIEWLGDITGNLIRAGLDWLTTVISQLLLAVADGIQGLIDMIMDIGRTVTVHDVIFGKIDKLSINFWGASSVVPPEDGGEGTESNEGSAVALDTAPVAVLKDIVSYWYGILQGIAVTVYLTMLLYIAIRILLSSTGESAEKYKEMLSSWIVGLVILFYFPIVMRYVVTVNDLFVGMLDSGAVEVPHVEGAETNDVMIIVRNRAASEGNLVLTIVYIIMLGQLIILLGIYYKRVLMVGFLITLFPIIAALYVWEKTNKGSSSAFSNWTKEFVIVVLTQTFHAVVYVILIEGAYSAFVHSDGENWVVFIMSVAFLFQSERIIRAIFGMKSSANTIGDLASAGAAVWIATKSINKVFKGGPKSSNGDEQDLKEAHKAEEEAIDRTTINNTLRNTIMTATSTQNALNAARGANSMRAGGGTSANIPEEQPMDNLDTAQNVMKAEALDGRTKRGIISKAIGTATDGIARGAGITLGITSGLATGSLTDGIANSVAFNEVAGMASGVVKGFGGWVKGAYAGQRLKARVRSGAMDARLKAAGFDINGQFDPDPIINTRKQEIIREALAQQISATRRGGTVKGELKFIEAVDKGRRTSR